MRNNQKQVGSSRHQQNTSCSTWRLAALRWSPEDEQVRQGVTCAAGPREPNTVWKCSMRISVKTLMGIRALREMEPCRGQTRFTPNTQARLDGLILLTMLSWDTWRRHTDSSAAGYGSITVSVIRSQLVASGFKVQSHYSHVHQLGSLKQC